MVRAATAVVLSLLTISAAAQEKLVESIEVRVVNVDVVVRDKAGNPVNGLTRDDFEILENGKPQTITNLYEIRPEKGTPATTPAATAAATLESPLAPAELRQRKVVFFIDNYSLPPLRRNEIFKALLKFVDEQLRPEDQAMVVVWNQGTKIVNQFTSDKSVIRASIAALSDSSNSGFTNQMEIDQLKRRAQELIDIAKEERISWSDAYSQATSGVDSYAEHATHNAKRILDSLAKTTDALAGVDGKKVLVFAGAHLPDRPGMELYTYMYNSFSSYMPRLPFNMEAISGRTGAVHYTIEQVARSASSNGVTLYMIDAADVGRDAVSAERGGDTRSNDEQTEQFQTYTNTAIAYQTLARITGGVALTNTDNFNYVFEAIARDFNSYYSLGYKPASPETAGQRKIVVRMKNPAYRARTRETYTPKSTDEQMNDRVIANIYNEMHGDWKIELAPGTPQKEGGKFKVPVRVSIDPTITLLPQGDQLVGGFTLYIAVGNGSGGRSTVTRSPQTLKIPVAAEQQLRAKPMTFTAMVVMNPGENTLSIAVMDQISSATGFARAKISAQ